MIDKNQALIDYLLTCEPIYNSPLYFNFADAKNGINQLITLPNDKALDNEYIDGSVSKMYSLTIIVYLSIANKAIVKVAGVDNENVIDYSEVMALMEWIGEQNIKGNYPNFGDNCIVEKIETTSNAPRLDQINTTVTPPLATYSFTINVKYLDNTNKLWK
jgi:hypothetical protein